MRTRLLRFFALLLGIGFCSSAGFGQEKEEPKKTAFQETAESLLGGCLFDLMEFGYFPHLTSLPHLTSWESVVWPGGSQIPAEFQKRFESFPGDLLKALDNGESANHEAAVVFLASYVSLARNHTVEHREKDLSHAVGLALSPHTAKIRKALDTCLKGKTPKTRLLAALTLLSLDEHHARANEAFQGVVASSGAELLGEASRFIGVAHLTSPQAMAILGRMLKHADSSVRESAAGAVITLGPSARDLMPALIAFLEIGENANGKYWPTSGMSLPQAGNLALKALESLKEHARPAVPAILARFAKAKEPDRLAMLSCLAGIGCKDAACLAVVRESLRSEKADPKLAAACTLLHLTPGDREATEMLKQALADKKTRTNALHLCGWFGPPSPEIVRSLVQMLDDEEEAVRVEATRALAGFGPHAASAVPGLAKLLAKEEDSLKHTFLSLQAAAYALGKIRGKEAAAALLRVADSKTSGAYFAMIHLAGLGDDLPPTTLAVLVRALTRDDMPKVVAAMTLSNFGERARPVRRDLERLREDPALGPILDTALGRVPANPR
jgi:HEAT repeat protein